MNQSISPGDSEMGASLAQGSTGDTASHRGVSRIKIKARACQVRSRRRPSIGKRESKPRNRNSAHMGYIFHLRVFYPESHSHQLTRHEEPEIILAHQGLMPSLHSCHTFLAPWTLQSGPTPPLVWATYDVTHQNGANLSVPASWGSRLWGSK